METSKSQCGTFTGAVAAQTGTAMSEARFMITALAHFVSTANHKKTAVVQSKGWAAGYLKAGLQMRSGY